MYIVNLSNVDKEDIDLVGGKGANLGELIQAGFPVPNGFAITSSAYDHYIKSNGFESEIRECLEKIDSNPDRIKQVSLEIREFLNAGSIPDDLYNEIEEKYSEMGRDARVAVRSSATAEDLPEASFAGQQDTYLNICRIDRLLDSIKSCFASLWTERAIEYRKQTGFDREKISLAVVVQEMVESDVSGVLFTANPVNNNRNEMILNASYGLGESIVSGLVTPDTYILDAKKYAIKKKILGTKTKSIVYDPVKRNTERSNSSSERNKFCLEDDDIQLLASIGKQLESHFDYPQDIEWAMKDGKFYILQSRRITTLEQESNQGTDKNCQTNSKNEQKLMFIKEMLSELYPNLPYPLELNPINTTIKLSFFKGTEDPIKIKANGEIEFNINSEENKGETTKNTPKKSTKRNDLNFEENQFRIKEVFKESCSQLTAIQKLNFKSMKIEALICHLKEIKRIFEKNIELRFKHIINPYMATGSLIDDGLKEANLEFSEYDLLSDLHYKTWAMNLELNQLAEFVNSNDGLKESILDLPEDESFTSRLMRIRKEFPEFDERYYEIFKNYGWKSTNSHQSFSASSWNENPESFINLLKVVIKKEKHLVGNGKYEKLCARIETAFPLKDAMELQRKIDEFRIYHQNREESVYFLEWCFGLDRLILREITEKYPSIFSSYTDILYLSMDEVCSLTDEYAGGEISDIIATRKRAEQKNQNFWNTLNVKAAVDPESILKGVSGSAGKVKGKVCVIHDISEFNKLKPEDILVCEYTDPFWTPLFSIAKAVVSDTGGVLSHCAIVAREFGIPAVMGCGNASKILSDGQEIIVNGDEGRVEMPSLLQEKCN